MLHKICNSSTYCKGHYYCNYYKNIIHVFINFKLKKTRINVFILKKTPVNMGGTAILFLTSTVFKLMKNPKVEACHR